MKKTMTIFLCFFTGMCMALSDGPDVVSLWHFDETYTSGTDVRSPDDDSVMLGRSADIYVRNGATLATPGYDGTGAALSLDGIDQFAHIAWGNHDNIKVEMSFKAESLPADAEKYLIEIKSIFRLFINTSNQLQTTIWDDTGNGTHVSLSESIVAGQWYSLEASYSPDGYIDLFLWEYPSGNLVDSREVAHGNGILQKGESEAFVLGAYRVGGNKPYHGLIDELRVSNYSFPEFSSPYQDEAGTVYALWHFDEFADPNVTGSPYEQLPDDDSDNEGRGADLTLYTGASSEAEADSGDGPTLVDPAAEGVGYPMDNPAFGKAAYLDDPILVEADSFRVPMEEVQGDPRNIRFETWFRPDDDFIDTQTGVGTILDRWGQMVIRYVWHSDTNNWAISVPMWRNEEGAGATTLSFYYEGSGIDPKSWVHVAVENYYGDLKLYVNGFLADSTTISTDALSEDFNRDTMFVGCRYNPQSWFWGYIDEMKISQAVYDVGCGAWGYLPGDLNEDCIVDINDLKILVDQWLATTDPQDPLAVEGETLQYENYNLPHTSTTPTIDGTLSSGEWDDAKKNFMGMPELVTAPNIGSQKYEIPDSHADFSADWYYKWDSDYLYVGVKVYDDELLFDAGYPDDHVVFALDLLDMGEGEGNVVLYNMYRDYFGDAQIDINGAISSTFTPDNAVYDSAVQADGWSYEVAFKWTDFGGYTPTEGDVHGTAVLMCDQDDSLGSTRDTFLMDAGEGDTDVLTKPELYKTAALTSGLVCGDDGYLANDINKDCDVDLFDYSDMAAAWLECSDPNVEGCIDAR